LTIGEIQILYKGFALQRRLEREAQEEQNPELRGKRVRSSDINALEKFKAKRNLK